MAPFLNITFDRPFFLFIYDALNKVFPKDNFNPPLNLLCAKGINIEQSLGPSLKITLWDGADNFFFFNFSTDIFTLQVVIFWGRVVEPERLFD